MAENKNTKLYESLRAVPENAQKSFTNGRFNGTDINPMWRIKRMTEMFGPCGIGWYYEVVNRSIEKSLDGSSLCTFIGINLYIRDEVSGGWSKPIYGEGGNTFCQLVADKKTNTTKFFTTDEAYKMALTDAFSNATKQLGLGADVWFERDKVHSTKYDQQQEVANGEVETKPVPQPIPQSAPKPAPAPKPAVKEFVVPDNPTPEQLEVMNCKTKKELNTLFTTKGWAKNTELVNFAASYAQTLAA